MTEKNATATSGNIYDDCSADSYDSKSAGLSHDNRNHGKHATLRRQGKSS
ncbi:hypothetical protein M407DRAFT_32836 [Tulasnella calospora MUT 4182]|uniref:Uncharacterized protein n=1 Tax=Tulasnella calospora MUT 4182 TaxID=1051891 RepID=A0A0C3Q427_9AGAM|nr:hypothetical protein M407DRAFT_32836 [Tulasnella calospora MUT 4182]